jgi:hypothetical protein
MRLTIGRLALAAEWGRGPEPVPRAEVCALVREAVRQQILGGAHDTSMRTRFGLTPALFTRRPTPYSGDDLP